MKKNSSKHFLKKYLKPVGRHYAIITIVIILGFLMLSVRTIGYILEKPSDSVYEQNELSESINQAKFDEATIQKIEALRSSQENASLDLPGGRINPFTTQ